MTVRKHLHELRGRLLLVAAVFITASTVAYMYRDSVIDVLLAPLHGQRLSYLTVGGGFSFIFMLTIWCGLAATLPFLFLSVYKFISPAIPERAQGKAVFVIAMSFILLMCGAAFGYFLAIPGAIQFLLTYADEYVQAMLTADSYLSFVLAYTIGLGILFQLPLLLLIINWITPLHPKKLFLFERYVIVLSFIAAAIITPTPDAVNQTIIALPIIGMYQLGVLMVIWVNWRSKHAKREMEISKVLPQEGHTVGKTTTMDNVSSMQKRLSMEPVRRPAPVTGVVEQTTSAQYSKNITQPSQLPRGRSSLVTPVAGRPSPASRLVASGRTIDGLSVRRSSPS